MADWHYSGWCEECETSRSVCLCKPPEVQAVYDERRQLNAELKRETEVHGLTAGVAAALNEDVKQLRAFLATMPGGLEQFSGWQKQQAADAAGGK